MWLKNIEIANFRNISSLNLEFSPGLNTIEGRNSQGKTNLLEAIYCLARGESFRTFTDRELIKWDQDYLYLRGEGEKKHNFSIYELSLGKDTFKTRKVNSRSVPLKDTDHWLWTVVFSNQDMKIIQGSPSCRRRFLDNILSFLYPDFSYLHSSFRQVLKQRNVLLGNIVEKKDKHSRELAGWDAQFVKLGSKIAHLRLRGLSKLAPHFYRIIYQLMGQDRSPSLVYTSSFLGPETTGDSLENIKDQFSRKLEKLRGEEIQRQISLVGPHRDDFQIRINNANQRIFGSQGEQRAVAIALKLAEVELIKERENEPPVVILDDITSDLDPLREQFLLRAVKNAGQLFVSTQDLSRFDKNFLTDSIVFHIKGGNVQKNDKR